ncbi:SPW repeat protein [Streptomyces spiralis]|uniref:Membrane protein n=1 Tax=Streptomyces spiralis TaxID=66376 RepID=A0A919AHR2_9ACTN|nr:MULTISPECIES: SPW repeat protein [Streptomyces]GHF06410.1 membrane protein [Streptomyces spiralis]
MSYPHRSSDVGAHPEMMGTHPEMAEMRERLERTASSGPAMAVEGLIVLTGLYAAISPWVVHFAIQPAITVNNLIVGLAIAMIGVGLALAPERMFRLAWALVPLGVWLFISPWVVTVLHTARAGIIWNNCWVGAITVVLGLAAMGLTIGKARLGAGR